VFATTLPMIVVGSAGSGKAALTLENVAQRF
jgi:DNA helicase IV